MIVKIAVFFTFTPLSKEQGEDDDVTLHSKGDGSQTANIPTAAGFRLTALSLYTQWFRRASQSPVCLFAAEQGPCPFEQFTFMYIFLSKEHVPQKSKFVL